MQGLGALLPIILLGGVLFMMTRSQKKQQKERQDVLSAMSVGDHVVTIGGLHGVISEILTEKDTVVLDCEGIFLEFNRSAIRTVKPAELDSAAVTPEVAVVEEATEVVADEETPKED